MHRRSCLLGLFASVAVGATMSAAAAEALAASGLADHDLDEFGSQFGFFFGRRRRRFGRRRWRGGSRSASRRGRGGGGGSGGGGSIPAEAASGSKPSESILRTSKPVPLSDQPAVPRAGAPANR
jgi:hypothetical protein